MSEHLDRNKQYLENHHPQVLRNFLASDSPDTEDRSHLSIKTLSSEIVDVPIQDRQYRAQTRQTLRNLTEEAPVLIVGLDRPSELIEIAKQTGDVPMLYVEFDPEQFRKVLREVALSEEPLAERCSIYYPKSGLDFVLSLASWIHQEERYVDKPQLVPGSKTLGTLLRGTRDIDQWFQALFFESNLNLTNKMCQAMVQTLEQAGNEVPEAYFYRRFRDLIELIAVASAGIDTVENERAEMASTQSLPPVSVVILSWNRWDLTKGCIESVLEEHELPDGSQVLVVDNGSTDESPERLREYEDEYDELKALLLDENRGPAGGREAATPHIEHDLAVYLDNDTRIRGDRWLDYLLSPFFFLDRVGAVGAFGVIHLSDSDPSRYNQKIVLPDVDVPVSWCSGYCVALRVEALKDAGGWRPDLYQKWGSEDVSIHWALRENGWYSVVPGNVVPVDHLSAHTDEHYDYDFEETERANMAVFRKQWGKRLRILNLSKSNMRPEKGD